MHCQDHKKNIKIFENLTQKKRGIIPMMMMTMTMTMMMLRCIDDKTNEGKADNQRLLKKKTRYARMPKPT
jgi:uncharacterized iron-regulated protein